MANVGLRGVSCGLLRSSQGKEDRAGPWAQLRVCIQAGSRRNPAIYTIGSEATLLFVPWPESLRELSDEASC